MLRHAQARRGVPKWRTCSTPGQLTHDARDAAIATDLPKRSLLRTFSPPHLLMATTA